MSVYVAIYEGKQIAKGDEKKVVKEARAYVRDEVDQGSISLEQFFKAKVAIHRYDHCYNLTFKLDEGDDRPKEEPDSIPWK